MVEEKNLILAQVLLTISLVIFRGKVELFVVWKIVNFISIQSGFFL